MITYSDQYVYGFQNKGSINYIQISITYCIYVKITIVFQCVILFVISIF